MKILAGWKSSLWGLSSWPQNSSLRNGNQVTFERSKWKNIPSPQISPVAIPILPSHHLYLPSLLHCHQPKSVQGQGLSGQFCSSLALLALWKLLALLFKILKVSLSQWGGLRSSPPKELSSSICQSLLFFLYLSMLLWLLFPRTFSTLEPAFF